MRVRFSKFWKHALDGVEVHTYPRDWEGTLPDEIAKRAIRAGVAREVREAVRGAVKTAAPKAATPVDGKGTKG